MTHLMIGADAEHTRATIKSLEAGQTADCRFYVNSDDGREVDEDEVRWLLLGWLAANEIHTVHNLEVVSFDLTGFRAGDRSLHVIFHL